MWLWNPHKLIIPIPLLYYNYGCSQLTSLHRNYVVYLLQLVPSRFPQVIPCTSYMIICDDQHGFHRNCLSVTIGLSHLCFSNCLLCFWSLLENHSCWVLSLLCTLKISFLSNLSLQSLHLSHMYVANYLNCIYPPKSHSLQKCHCLCAKCALHIATKTLVYYAEYFCHPIIGWSLSVTQHIATSNDFLAYLNVGWHINALLLDSVKLLRRLYIESLPQIVM